MANGSFNPTLTSGYVSPLELPEETFATKFGNLGKQMQAAAMQQAERQSQAAMQRRSKDQAAKNKQINDLYGFLQKTENWSTADVENMNFLFQQAEELLDQDPEKYKAIMMDLGLEYSAGKVLSEAWTGSTNSERYYMEIHSGQKKFQGPENLTPVTSDDDHKVRVASYNNLGVPLVNQGQRAMFQDPNSGLMKPVYEYYQPGTETTISEIFTQTYQAQQGFNVGSEYDPTTGRVTMYATDPEGKVVDQITVAGTLRDHPFRTNNSGFFTPETIDIQRMPVSEYIKKTTSFNSGLRRSVQAGDITEDEAKGTYTTELSARYNNPNRGGGMRASSLDMWKEKYQKYWDEQGGKYDPEYWESIPEGGTMNQLELEGIESPFELYVNTAWNGSGIVPKPEKEKDPSKSGKKSLEDDVNGFGVTSGWADAFFADLEDTYQLPYYTDSELGSIAYELSQISDNGVVLTVGGTPKSVYDLQNASRYQLPISGTLKYNYADGGEKNFNYIEAYHDQNVILLQKANERDWIGKVNPLATGVSPESLQNAMHDKESNLWVELPSARYVAIPIYKDRYARSPQDRFSDAFKTLSADFAKHYGGSANAETLFNLIQQNTP